MPSLGEDLINAAREGDIEKATALIKAGAKVDYESSGGRTPLMAAASAERQEMVEFLIKQRADPMQKGNEGQVAIEDAASKNHLILMLMLAHVSPEKQDEAVKIALRHAASYNNQESVEALLPQVTDQQIRKEAFIKAARTGNVALVEYLYEACENVDNTILQEALINVSCYYGTDNHKAIIRFIVNKIDIDSRPRILTDALEIKCSSYQADEYVQHSLIEHGAESGDFLRDAILQGREDNVRGLDPLASTHIALFKEAMHKSPPSGSSSVKNPFHLYRLQWMITESERANASQDTHFLTADGNVPEHFSSATLPIPTLPTDALALAAIKRIKFVIIPSESNNNHIQKTDLKEDSSIIMQLTYRDGNKKTLTVMPEYRSMVFKILQNEDLLQDVSFWNKPKELIEKDIWKGLSNYPETSEETGQKHHVGTTDFYRALHEAMVNRYRHNPQNAIYLEVGAGEGKLSHQLFDALSPEHTVHIIGTELHKENVDTANAEKKGTFYQCNSITLLDDMERTGAMEKIEILQQEQSLPIIINASGALNHQVLDHFQGLRAVQNLRRLSPDRFHITGLTDNLFNKHILKNSGFTIEQFEQNFVYNTKHCLTLSSRDDQAYFEQHADKISLTGKLDLSLNANPLKLLQGLPLALLEKVTTIDLSHSFMRGNEAASIADHISAHCTQLKSIEWDYHFNGKESDNGVDDRLHIQQLQVKLSSQGISFSSKHTDRSQDLAFSRSFVERERSKQERVTSIQPSHAR